MTKKLSTTDLAALGTTRQFPRLEVDGASSRDAVQVGGPFFAQSTNNSPVLEPNDTIPEATETGTSFGSLNTFNASSTIGDNANVDPNDDVDMFRFELDQGDRVTIDIDAREVGTGVESVLRLFDSSGQQVAFSDDDPAPGENLSSDSYIDFAASVRDSYVVGVSSFENTHYDPLIEGSGSGDISGDYDIEITTSARVPGPGEPNDTLAQAVDSGIEFGISNGFATSAVIGDNPNVLPKDDVDLVRFELAQGDRVTIDIDASDFGSDLDPVLQVFDSNGQQVAVSDDDPAPGEDFSLDSYIDFTAASRDTYFAGVSSFANFSYDPLAEGSGSGASIGDYTIEITAFAALNGTSDNDTLIGTPGNDRINGLAGNDTLIGEAGDDVLDGGANNDELIGGDGRDDLRGGYGGDLLLGEADDDVLDGGAGDDELLGGDGNDDLRGNKGKDLLRGEAGDDLLDGGPGNDQLTGGAGRDELKGGKGWDQLLGDTGNDVLDGGAGNDRLAGGADNDTLAGGGAKDSFMVAAGDGVDTITDFGGVGRGGSPSQTVRNEVDVIQFSGAGLTAENMLLAERGDDLQITFEGIDGTTVVLDNFALEILDNLPGGLGNIRFAGQNQIQDDFDVVNANSTPAQVLQRDSVTFLNDLDNNTRGFSSSDDVINGQGGVDVLRGLSGDDLLRGGLGNDILIGGRGDDVLVGGTGGGGGGAISASVGLNFTASTRDIHQLGAVPDTMGGVGPDHIVELINRRYSVYDKETGALLHDSDQGQFWRDAGLPQITNQAVDPRVIYDPFSERWFATAVDLIEGDQDNQILLGVSETADPTQGWRALAVDSDSADLRFADFPTLGFNADGVFISADMFPITGRGANGVTNTILSVPKADLLGSTSLTQATVSLFENNSLSETGFNLQPIVDLDNTGLPAIFLAAGGSDQFKRTEIIGDIASPQLDTSVGTIAVAPFFSPPSAEQPGPKQNFRNTGGFITNQVLKDGSIWGVHAVGNEGRSALRWFEIDEATNTLLQEGLIADPSLDFHYASIAVNGLGDVAIGFSGSGETQFVSTFATLGTTEVGLTTFTPPRLLKEGVSDYQSIDFAGRNRWGDYSATVVDPNDPQVFWTFQEFVSAENIYSTQITQLIVTRSGGQDRFRINAGDGTDTIRDFGGIGRGDTPSQAVLDELDSLQFTGAGFTARNMLLTKVGADLEITFEGIADSKVVLQNFSLEDLENLPGGLGNILFDGQSQIQDVFDIIDADARPGHVFTRDGVTFLNDLNNTTRGLWGSDDVINGQGGNDVLRGLSGADLLRGGAGNDKLWGGNGGDQLFGGDGNDRLFGQNGDDTLAGGAGADRLIGGDGDDLLICANALDILKGNAGDDILALTFAEFDRIDGGAGQDTLRLDGAGEVLDLTAILDWKLRGIETLDIAGSGDNTLVLDRQEVLNLGSGNTVQVLGDAGDVVETAGGFISAGQTSQDGFTFDVYTAGNATLLIQDEIDNQLIM